VSPLGAVCAGLLLAVLDVRVPGLDALPDVLGWVLVVVGLSRLPLPGAPVLRTRTVALVCAVLSLADLVLPVRTVSQGDPQSGPVSTTTATAQPEGVQALLLSAYSVATTVAIVLLSLALRARAAQSGDARAARTLGVFAVLHAVVGALDVIAELLALVTGFDQPREVDGPAAALVLVTVLAVLAVVVCFVVTLYRMRDRPWASALGPLSPAAPAGPSAAGPATTS
jgi:hypothetical protein